MMKAVKTPGRHDEPIVTEASASVYSDHSRNYDDNRYVYPVISRRSGGVSLGINLNPDKVCNFDCVYCQVDRQLPPTPGMEAVTDATIAQILVELRHLIELHQSGALFAFPPLDRTPLPLRRLSDIALSGDGEPSTFPRLYDLVDGVIRLKEEWGLKGIPMVMITNASGLDRPETRRALQRMDQSDGRVWAKLDAGTESYYHRVCRTGVPYGKILKNILQTALERPVVIQSCFFTLDGVGPSDDEIESYGRRLMDIREGGGRIALVQIYTIARRPAESEVGALPDSAVEALVVRIRDMTGLKVEGYGRSPGLGSTRVTE